MFKLGSQCGLLPNDLLELNLGQVQAVVDGYGARQLDATAQSIWTGFYAAYYFGKHPKPPHVLIHKLMDDTNKPSRGNSHEEVDMEAEIEKFAQRDLAFLTAKEGKING